MKMTEISFESTVTMTQAEFARWARAVPSSDVNHYELLNGRVVMTPPAGHPHGSIEARVVQLLANHVDLHNLGRVMGSSQGFELPSGDTVEPDASFVTSAHWPMDLAEGPFLKLIPDLVVEIRSPSTASRDRGEKKAIYERNGVREYWIVDPRSRQLTIFRLQDSRFDLGTMLDSDEQCESRVLDQLSFEVGQLFR